MVHRTPAELFARSAERDFPGLSPFYAELATRLAARPELIEVLDDARPGQRQPILLLAAVHNTLLAHPDEPLAEWYASVRDDPRPLDAQAIVAWGDLLDTHGGEIARSVQSRSVQTNEVNRCVALTLAYSRAASRAHGRPIALLELGTSAGLNLGFDSYGYRITNDLVGPAAAPLVLTAEFRGVVPRFEIPAIAWRMGIDREPLDPADRADARWLLACTWPDQRERFGRLRLALQTAAGAPHQVRRADIVTDLAAVLAEIPADHVPLVAHSWVLWYVARDDRRAIASVLAAEAARRGGLAWVHAEAPGVVADLTPPIPHPADEAPTLVGLRWSTGGGWDDESVCWMHPHGTWVRAIDA